MMNEETRGGHRRGVRLGREEGGFRLHNEYAWMDPRLQARKVPGLGHGVFATARIRRHDLITVFGGHVMTVLEESRLPEPLNDYSHQITAEQVIGITRKSHIGPTDFFNHNCDPNTGFKGQIFLVAMRDIRAGEEVTFDYCMVLKRHRWQVPYLIECNCGAADCRGRVTSNDWRIPRLQRKYYGYFQWYIQDVIDNGRSTINYPKLPR